MKTLKKYVAMLALASLVLGPVQALAQTSLDPDPTTVNTGFTFGGGGATGNTLAIKAVWQDVDENPLTDDTQINPPSNCGLTKPVTVCAVVQDDSLSYGMEKTAVDAAIDGRAWLYYDSLLGGTDNFANASNASNLAYLVGGNINNYIDLTSLTYAAGIQKFCTDTPEAIKQYYGSYDYSDICGSNDPNDPDNASQLYKGQAYVFCGTTNLSYEAAAGKYEVQYKVMDVPGNYVYNSDLTNNSDWFTYEGSLAYAVDFGAIDYGPVQRDQWDGDTLGNNIGDMRFGVVGTDGSTFRPTVRNIGNLQLQMQVAQSNMQNTEGWWLNSVNYRAKVGSPATWTEYLPGTTLTSLEGIVPLSNIREMDFGIKVGETVQSGSQWSGTMTLDAIEAPFSAAPVPVHTAYQCVVYSSDIPTNN